MKRAPAHLRFAVVAVDIAVFGIIDGKLSALVSDVHRPPHYLNTVGFLGGIIDSKENTDEAAKRVLQEKGDIRKVYLEQLYTFSGVNRDKRNRVVSVGYLGLVKPDTAASYKHKDARFVPVSELRNLAYDHDEVIAVAISRLKGKLSYTTIVQHLLPNHFTLTELQETYEIILGRSFDKRNFRKKILALDVILDTGAYQEGVKNRPAALYAFKDKNIKELSAIV